MNISESVQRGAQLLDDKYPGWAEQIDVHRLEMAECEHCILGQLYGDFLYANRFLDILCTVSYYGFDIRSDKAYDGWAQDYEQAWLEQIQQRRAA